MSMDFKKMPVGKEIRSELGKLGRAVRPQAWAGGDAEV